MPTSMNIILAAQEQQEKSWTFSEGELNPELVMNDRFSPCAKDRLISTHILVFFPPIETLSHPPEYGRLASHNYRPAALITQQDESSNKFDHFFTLEGGIESRRLFLRKPVILEKSKARLIGYPPWYPHSFRPLLLLAAIGLSSSCPATVCSHISYHIDYLACLPFPLFFSFPFNFSCFYLTLFPCHYNLGCKVILFVLFLLFFLLKRIFLFIFFLRAYFFFLARIPPFFNVIFPPFLISRFLLRSI